MARVDRFYTQDGSYIPRIVPGPSKAELDAVDRSMNPGSAAAITMGCLCPSIDNFGGRGFREKPGTFIIDSKCPFHGLLTTNPKGYA